VLEERLVDGDALPAVGDELEEQRLGHHRRRRAVLVESKVGVLELLEVVPALDERPERRRVLADAVPAAGCVADLVLRVGDPVLGLERDALDLEDAHLAVL